MKNSFDDNSLYLEIENFEDGNDENKERDVLNPTYYSNNELTEIYPEANIKVEREQYPIFQLKRKYDKQSIILDPDFQRAKVWKSNQQSELIESVLMGMPLPTFYLNESKDGNLIVVDGRQRLTTFFSYLNDEFKLGNLRILSYLNGSKFSDLDQKLQANLEDFQLITQVIKPPTPDRIKFDIFDRVNRGGTPLNNQEMRNALYQGKASKLLNIISKSQIFKKVTTNSINSVRMKDKYLILRTIAFYLWRKNMLLDPNGYKINYKNDLDEFLGNTMEFLNSLSDESIEQLENLFYKALENNYEIFGQDAYRRPSDGGKKKPINMILFESFNYLFTHFDTSTCRENKAVIKEICEFLLKDEELNRLLTSDRGRGIVIPDIFDIFDNITKEILYAVQD
ncbi:GmrSD restriction endonuclease domain-containing protein [Pontibacillus yanchengensis]|uniref:GmrSD restriction endonuclease domain-containing protein n=1 Tax=Pontibacillus yanchengensis TaxID=462910 RepID=UPI00136FEBFD